MHTTNNIIVSLHKHPIKFLNNFDKVVLNISYNDEHLI
jgi:hypothetical protein